MTQSPRSLSYMCTKRVHRTRTHARMHASKPRPNKIHDITIATTKSSLKQTLLMDCANWSQSCIYGDSSVNRWTAVTSYFLFSCSNTKADIWQQVSLNVEHQKIEGDNRRSSQWQWTVWLTEWLTPHITTLSRGSLARKSFTFWATKCFFLVLVLLAMDAAMLLAEAIFKKTGWFIADCAIIPTACLPLKLAQRPPAHGSAVSVLFI